MERKNNKRKAILIDGNSLLYTHFYATAGVKYLKGKDPSDVMKTKDGEYVNAVFSVSRFIKNLIKTQDPDFLFVAWDVKRSTLKRTQVYQEYKGHREKTSELIISQIKLMKRVLDEWGVKQFSLEGYEADDLIGTFSRLYDSDDVEVKIISKDNDVMQLINENVSVWQPVRNAHHHYEITRTKVTDLHIPPNHFEFNLDNFHIYHPDLNNPKQLIDVKALEGDKSDNIPGVKGIGEKSAIALVSALGNFENIMDLTKGVSKKKFDDTIKEMGVNIRSPYNAIHKYTEDAKVSRFLAEIVTDIQEVKENFTQDDTVFVENEEGRINIFKELEFKSLL